MSAIIALILANVVPIIGGVLSGFSINLIGALSSGGGKVALRLIPTAVRLAFRILRDKDAPEDLRRDAAAVAMSARPKDAMKAQQDIDQ